MSDDQELSTLEKMRAARLGQRRTDYQADLTRQQEEADRGDSRANPNSEPAKHKADIVMPFQSFEVKHVIEIKGPDGKSKEIWERAGFEGTYGDTGMITGLSMPIEEIRHRPDFVAEKWAVIGHGHENGPMMIGAYEDQKTARDMLGGITGDRFYDQRPLTQTTEAALYHGFAQSILEIPPDRPKLAERMTEGWTNDQITNHRLAQIDAAEASLEQARRDVFEQHPIQSTIRGPEWREEKAMERAVGLKGERPHEKLLGEAGFQGIDRW